MSIILSNIHHIYTPRRRTTLELSLKNAHSMIQFTDRLNPVHHMKTIHASIQLLLLPMRIHKLLTLTTIINISVKTIATAITIPPAMPITLLRMMLLSLATTTLRIISIHITTNIINIHLMLMVITPLKKHLTPILHTNLITIQTTTTMMHLTTHTPIMSTMTRRPLQWPI